MADHVKALVGVRAQGQQQATASIQKLWIPVGHDELTFVRLLDNN